MFSLLKLSYRNIFRNWRRSALTLSAIIISIVMTNYGIGLVKGQKSQMTNTARTTNTGDIKLLKTGYLDERETLPLDISIEDPYSVIGRLKNIDRIESVSPRVLFSIRIFFSNEELICTGAGIDAVYEDEVFSRKKGIIQGEYLDAVDEKVLIGTGLAELVNIKEGDWITIASRTKYGTITALDV